MTNERDDLVQANIDDQQAIFRAGLTDKYKNNPVPAAIKNRLSDELTSFASIPYSQKSKLSSLYGPGQDYQSLLSADWSMAFCQGAIRLHNDKTVSFPTRIEMANGEAVEVSIAENTQYDGLPWFLAYVPVAEHMKLRRDCNDGTTAFPPQSNVATDPLPPLLEHRFTDIQHSEDYVISPVPQEVYDELIDLGSKLVSFTWLSQRWKEKILECANSNLDVAELLNRDWSFALSNKIMRYYEGKVIFPISILRNDGESLIEVSLKRDRDLGRTGSMPWLVSFVDSFSRQKVRAGKALGEWAFFSDFDEQISNLSVMALAEQWDFDNNEGSNKYSILKSYLTYTFYRLQTEGKVLEDRGKGLAAFNTGLVNKTYETIYACFSPSNIGQPWRFEAFCKAGSKLWGKKLVEVFDPLPQRASYFEKMEDLLFDGKRNLSKDTDHILLDNIERLPTELLSEELRDDPDALKLLRFAVLCDDDSKKKIAFNELRNLIDGSAKLKRRLINRLDDAIDLAQKRVEWNFKTAVPAFYPTKNSMSLLLPLDLTENDKPDVALVVELMESGAYIGQTILTMEMAYNNARLICRPDSDWLNTSIKASFEGI